ncbi:MAG: 50S ribosomal protein L10 [Desulfobacterales bacterium]|nr:50S ribosomal protein L10 [Desulfobacterales bacterium]
MNKEEKEKFIADLHGRLEKSEGTFLVEYQGLNVEATNRLRNEIRKVNAEFQVVKNRLLKLACKETESDLIKDSMQGPTALALTYDDVVGVSRVLADFAKEYKQLKIKIGQISGRIVDSDGIKRLAGLPGKDILLAQALSVMQAVPTSLVRALNGITTRLMYVLKAIVQQKEE